MPGALKIPLVVRGTSAHRGYSYAGEGAANRVNHLLANPSVAASAIEFAAGARGRPRQRDELQRSVFVGRRRTDRFCGQGTGPRYLAEDSQKVLYS